MAASVTDRQQGFGGGLNTVSDPMFLQPNQARRLDNVRVDPSGKAIKRLGSRRTSSATASGNTLIWLRYWPSQNILFAQDSVFAKWQQSPGTLTGNVWSTVTGGTLGFGTGVPFVDSTGTEYFYNIGTGGLGKLSTISAGLTNVAVSGTPLAYEEHAGLVVYNARLWAWPGDDGAHPANVLYYSDLYNGDSLGVGALSGGQINVTTFGNTPIYSGFVVGASLLICHKRGVSRLTGWGQDDTSVQPQPVSTEFAICGRDAFAVADDGGGNNVAYALGLQGLVRMTESGITPVGTIDRPDPTRPIIFALTQAGTSVARTRVAYNAQTNEVVCWLPTVGMYVYNTVSGVWSGPFTGACLATSPQGLVYISPYLYFADESGWVLRLESTGSYTDNTTAAGTAGTAVTAVVQCHRMTAGSPIIAKGWRRVDIEAELTTGSASPSVAMATDSGTATDSTSVTPTTNQRNYTVQAGYYGPYIDVTITDAGTLASAYSAVTVEGFPTARR